MPGAFHRVVYVDIFQHTGKALYISRDTDPVLNVAYTKPTSFSKWSEKYSGKIQLSNPIGKQEHSQWNIM